MRKPHPQRRRFLAALRLKGSSLRRWGAAQRPPVTAPSVSQVLSGRATSARLADAISHYANRWGRWVDSSA